MVYVSNSTYIASISPLLYQSEAQPSFIDVDKFTGNMNLELLESKILKDISDDKRPRVIVFTHNYGFSGNMDELIRIKLKYGLVLIEDAAEAFGSEYKNQKCGTFSDYAVLSFNANKICTTLGGGALILNSQKEKNEVKKLANHYKSINDYYHEKLGYNYRMNDLAAFIGCYQLNNIKNELNKKNEIHMYYYESFHRSTLFKIYDCNNLNIKSNYWLNVIHINSEKSLHKTINNMRSKGIEVRRYWVPLSNQPFLEEYLDDVNQVKVAQKLFKSCLLLPSSISLTESEQSEVIKCLKQIER